MTDRRQSLKVLAVSTGGFLLAACQPGAGDQVVVPTLAELGHIQTAPATQSPPIQPTTDTPRPEGVEPERGWPSVERGDDGILVTKPLSRFYETRYSRAIDYPDLTPETWQLAVNGWVRTPVTLNFSDLAGLTTVMEMRTLECISNPVGGTLIGNTVWKGVGLGEVLSKVGVRTGAKELRMSAADGYETSIPIELAQDPTSLLVYEMDGAPLTIKHGYPVRVLLPGRYGQKQPKWITDMEVTTAKTLGYWESRGWSNEATIQVNSQIWEPDGRVKAQNSAIDIWGIAHASTSGVAGVEVSTDAGLSWKPADLLPGPSTLVWTEWHFQWTPSLQPGTVQNFTLMVRATDGAGTVQRKAISEAGVLDSTFPDGTSDIQQIVVTVEAPS